MARDVFCDRGNCVLQNKRATKDLVETNLEAWHREDFILCLLRLRRYVQGSLQVQPGRRAGLLFDRLELSYYRMRVTLEDAVAPFDDWAWTDTTLHGVL